MSEAPQQRRRWRDVDGVLLFDKPQGLSSNDALQKVRRLFSAAKAGHTGTLDPMATGLLPVCFGEATKFSNRLLEADKCYRATARLGQTTTTGDADGEVLQEREVTVTAEALAAICARFVGQIEQLPPMYSALKHQGRSLYEYAREGIEIERATRQITVYSLEVLRCEPEQKILEFVVRASKGTYVRTLAEDIGEAAGCGAHLVALRREAIADMRVADALTLEQIAAIAEEDREALLATPDALLAHLPALHLDAAQSRVFLHGQSVRADVAVGEYRIYAADGAFVGLAAADATQVVKPVRLIASKADVK